MGYKVLNNAFSTLAGAINAIATSLTVATGHGDRFPVIAGADYTYITLEDASGNIEIVKVTARSTASDVMTIERAQDGTVARSWAAGDIIELRVIAALLDMAIAHVDDTTDAHLASAIKNIPSGSIAAQTVQAAINELDGDIAALSSSLGSVSSALTAHINDTSDAHDASAISYSGGTGMSATDVEGAIDELANEKANIAGQTFTGDVVVPDEAYDATAWNGSLEVPTKNAVRDIIENKLTTLTTAGTAPAFTLTPSMALVSYAAGNRYYVKFHADATSPTINVSTLGAKNIKNYDAAGVKQPSVIKANQIGVIEYDGTDFVLLNPIPFTPSMVRLNTANGYGSTNTKIARFTNVVTNQGSDITYADSATLGASFTINTNGVYAISFTAVIAAATSSGISLNSTQLTTNLSSITITDVVCSGSAGGGGTMSTGATLYLPSGSVIRPHGDAAAFSGTLQTFTITRVA